MKHFENQDGYKSEYLRFTEAGDADNIERLQKRGWQNVKAGSHESKNPAFVEHSGDKTWWFPEEM